MFKALLLKKNENEKKAIGTVEHINLSELPAGEVLVKVNYSTLNYKDALAITSSSPIIRNFPMVPGIDFSGEVEESSSENFKIGDKVILNGFGVGERFWGGMSQKARVKADWLIKLPENFSEKTAMAIGTAGYTAMLCILALEKNNITPDKGEVLVTGATGGVGSIATSLLSSLGFEICASTGRSEHHQYIKSLGANRIIDRSELSEKGKPLGKETWAAAVDSLGSHTLANICSSTKYGGVVTSCGLAQGFDFPSTVMPFILRGVVLVGIDSVYCPIKERQLAWNRLSSDLNLKHLETMTSVIPLSDVIINAEKMLKNASLGRIVIDVNA